MNLTQLIDDMKNRGLISVAPLKFKGQAKPVLEFIDLMTNTAPFNPTAGYCQMIGEYYAEAGGFTIFRKGKAE